MKFIKLLTQLPANTQKLKAAIAHAREGLSNAYKTPYGFLYCPEDLTVQNQVTQLWNSAKKLQPTALFIIGIGGSNLGAQALFEALCGKFHNYRTPGIKLWFVDTIDQNYTGTLLALAESELKLGNTILINIISQSGSTTEVLVNSALFLELLARYYSSTELQQRVIITTDKNSPLADYAQQQHYTLLEIPEQVGGRYSVFTAAGLFPLAVLGVDITIFCAGALAMRERCLSENSAENLAAHSALVIYEQYLQHKTILDTFIFSPDLAQLGAWYKQLIAESLGKKENIHGAVTNTGITPLLTIGTTDLHSATQLALGGPRDKFTVFITNIGEEKSIRVPDRFLPTQYNFLKQKSITEIKRAIFTGVQNAYAREQRPFITVEFPEMSAASLGQFMLFKMCEIVYLGNLLEINPFDQPAVELYKSETRRLLSVKE